MSDATASEGVPLPEIATGAAVLPTGVAPKVAIEPPLSDLASERIAELMRTAAEHEQAGRLDVAKSALQDVLCEAPEHHPALHLMGIIAFKAGNTSEAAQLIERSIVLSPTSALYHRNICEIYRVLGRLDEALAAGRRAAALAPEDVHCYHNLAVLHYHRLELEEALTCGECAIRFDPNFAGGHFGIAEAALLGGDFALGWDEYEWRFNLANAPPLLPATDRPKWDGAPIDGTLLLIADQGYGDVIQFARYIPWAAARCGGLAVACSAELHPVVKQQLGSGLLFDHWEDAPAFTAYSALSSLPRLAKTRLHTIPGDIPYLHCDPTQLAHWADRLDYLAPRGYRRIGIVWAGRPTHHNDNNRSTSLKIFEALADIPGLALLSLQKGAGQSQIGDYWGRAPLINLGPEIRNFGDTMAILECLERIITVDTSVAHLAGAMGKDTWIMLPYAPDWRWLLNRDDSPWYPTVRLFRQTSSRAWDEVMCRIAQELWVH